MLLIMGLMGLALVWLSIQVIMDSEARKYKKVMEKQAYNKRKEKEYKQAKKRVKQARKDMLDKPCPHQENDSCQADCVHFFKGFTEKAQFMDRIYIGIKNPRCKLWK